MAYVLQKINIPMIHSNSGEYGGNVSGWYTVNLIRADLNQKVGGIPVLDLVKEAFPDNDLGRCIGITTPTNPFCKFYSQCQSYAWNIP